MIENPDRRKPIKPKSILLKALLYSVLLLPVIVSSCNATTPVRTYYTLTVSATPENGGTMTPVEEEYRDGMIVTITAEPAEGYALTHWSGDIPKELEAMASDDKDPVISVEIDTGTEDTSGYLNEWTGVMPTQINVEMDEDKTIVAHFAKLFPLTTSVDPPGSGNVSPSGGHYPEGMEVTVTAMPETGYGLAYWDGAGTGNMNTTSVVIKGDTHVTAHFDEALTDDENTISVMITGIEMTPDIPDDPPDAVKNLFVLKERQKFVIVNVKVVSVGEPVVIIRHNGEAFDGISQRWELTDLWTNVDYKPTSDGIATVLRGNSQGVFYFQIPEDRDIHWFRFTYTYFDDWENADLPEDFHYGTIEFPLD